MHSLCNYSLLPHSVHFSMHLPHCRASVCRTTALWLAAECAIVPRIKALEHYNCPSRHSDPQTRPRQRQQELQQHLQQQQLQRKSAAELTIHFIVKYAGTEELRRQSEAGSKYAETVCALLCPANKTCRHLHLVLLLPPPL